jgi:hypothetical protein
MPATLGEHNLTIGQATLGSYFSTDSPDWSELPQEKLRWNISINASYDFAHEGITYCEPIRFYHESFWFSKPINNWNDLAGQVIQWSNPRDVMDSNGAKPIFYLWGHHDMEQGKIQFVEQKGCDFRVLWEGITAGYGAFFVDTWVIFERI